MLVEAQVEEGGQVDMPLDAGESAPDEGAVETEIGTLEGGPELGEGSIEGDIAASGEIDWASLIEDREGKKVFRADRVPEDVLFGYGDTDSDWFSRDDFDYRRNRYNQRMTELDKWRQERDSHYTEDGQSKGQLYDNFQTRFSENPAEFLKELAENVPDPVRFAYDVLAKHAPEAAQAVRTPLVNLLNSGSYNPAKYEAQHLQTQLEQMREQQQRAMQQQTVEQNRAQFKSSVEQLANGQLSDRDYDEIEAIYVEQWQLNQSMGQQYPDRYPVATAKTAYDAYIARKPQKDPVQEVIEQAAGKTGTPPRHVGQGGGGQAPKELTSDELARKLLRQRDQK